MNEIRATGAVKFTWEQQTLIFEVVFSTETNLEGVFTAVTFFSLEFVSSSPLDLVGVNQML